MPDTVSGESGELVLKGPLRIRLTKSMLMFWDGGGGSGQFWQVGTVSGDIT